MKPLPPSTAICMHSVSSYVLDPVPLRPTAQIPVVFQAIPLRVASNIPSWDRSLFAMIVYRCHAPAVADDALRDGVMTWCADASLDGQEVIWFALAVWRV